MITELHNKDININKLVAQVNEDESLILELLDNLNSKEETIRYNSYQIIKGISLKYPEKLYSYRDEFGKKLYIDNAYQMLIGIIILAHLCVVDKDHKFEQIFNKYCSLLNDRRITVSLYVLSNLGRIAKVKPNLQEKITIILLDSKNTHHKHKGLIAGAAIESFEKYYIEIEDKEKVLEFVKEQIVCDSPKTRKSAVEFLTKWDNK
ncbi:MAG TPA: hypothetical protein VKN64_11455 [Halanaerobiales bacterium]|nr:hypothetical protein [Halanaerobiales bacterium]